MDNTFLEREIDRLGDLYESIKDCIYRSANLSHPATERLLNLLTEMRNQSATNIQELNKLLNGPVAKNNG